MPPWANVILVSRATYGLYKMVLICQQATSSGVRLQELCMIPNLGDEHLCWPSWETASNVVLFQGLRGTARTFSANPATTWWLKLLCFPVLQLPLPLLGAMLFLLFSQPHPLALCSSLHPPASAAQLSPPITLTYNVHAWMVHSVGDSPFTTWC